MAEDNKLVKLNEEDRDYPRSMNDASGMGNVLSAYTYGPNWRVTRRDIYGAQWSADPLNDEARSEMAFFRTREAALNYIDEWG